MAEFSSFFKDSGGDRRYTADQFSEYFRNFLTDGIKNGGTNLQVYATDADMISRIKIGTALISGYYYSNTVALPLTHAAADTINPRIDRIVLRLDLNAGVRSVAAYILKGTPGAVPIAPTLTRDLTTALQYELSLCQILIPANSTVVLDSNITDERLDTSLCGTINSLIQVDSSAFQSQWNTWFASKTDEPGGEFYDEWKEWFDSVVDMSYTTAENVETQLKYFGLI